jgi:NADH dehydrogenase (ubiquinone) 1 alpha subcomplex subunit 6
MAQSRTSKKNSNTLTFTKIPTIIDFHWLDVTEDQFRHRVRTEFEQKRNVDSLPVLHRQLFQGQKDLEEMLNHWQQKTHIMRYFEADWKDRYNVERQKTFLQKFYEGN